MPLTCSYDEFADWLATYHKDCVKAAGDAVVKALVEYLDQELTVESERLRIRVGTPRAKKVARTWTKLQSEKYAASVGILEDVPSVIDDLLGVRIVCTNTSDEYRVIELLKALPTLGPGDPNPVLVRIEQSSRDYLGAQSKESGYRAWHVNVSTSVAHVMAWRQVTCEVQVRTLLQDSWGELTHEDTYKPGGDGLVSDLVRTLSRRMADLLGTLDDMAEDLRQELDVLNARAAEHEPAPPPVEDVSPATSQLDAAGTSQATPTDGGPVLSYLARRIAQLDRPLDLASLAWEVQREFGQDIARDWAGYGTFKSLVHAAVPDVRLTAQPPTYVVPAGFSFESYADGLDENGAQVPRAVLGLKSLDGSFPAVSRDALLAICGALAKGTQRAAKGDAPDIRFLNETTRDARDWSASVGSPVSRRLLNYVGKALLFAGVLRHNMSKEEVLSGFRTATTKRAEDLLRLTVQEEAELSQWLREPIADED